ncbi:MAG TPA: M20/M25/M40 family metallo-hydrolase [Verrucomicrobiota bacterium]|jgi:acetylornithine deacetylase/succinyl-diaminopimelate desuccinylase-like protein|nr:M20/M25/M40 family metallo-hydrolase [Verrucomicrobiota bacterium]OQC24705.1 MAG: Acetylornithine deacetylase [Verrucomicrobia bacterium ADurb.Bin063]HRR64027.1 M20/M25/M40 family metallo-hydrolase [Candidatus Paceibacterota bacterium]MBP8015031.1 M20/M25/M40 family metallo-hydrolase [Verrucomicrobiota bacterium]MDI9372645.1 M20/M25/M40 family metallo-hydrolase [Verrucomicrobiota bacterium]
MTKTERLLRELIALPSVNPAFLPARDGRAGEQRVADFLAVTAARAGLDVEFQVVARGRANVLARLSPRGRARQRILLAPHLDTVGAADEQFRPVTRQGRLFGRGACDTKGSAAAMLMALCELAQSRQRPAATEIVFAGLVDEEHHQAGARALVAGGGRADLALVGEPTGLRAATAHKGTLWLRLETRGKSAHGARPELGRNAVHAMARVVELLQTTYAAQLRRRRHPLLGCATVNVGAIQGGQQPNIVPDHCHILVDRRTLPGETDSGVRRELAGLLRRKNLPAALGPDPQPPCPPLATDPAHPLAARFLRSLGQRRPVGVPYFCDAAVLARGGIPSVVFGPGNIAQAHTAREWISLASLERGRELLLRFLRSLP